MGAGIEYLSWDGDPDASTIPHRPSTDNLGGDDLENDEVAPPGPNDPDATAWDAMVREIAALAQTAAAAKVTITFDSGDPQWELFAAPGSVTTGDLTLADAGVGVTEITWPENTFPAASVWPHGLTLHSIGVGFAEAITNGIRVTTTDTSETPEDIAFTVCIG